MGSIIKFGKGSLVGSWGKDSIWVGGKEVTNQYMAFADQADCFEDGTGILMGLGYPSMAAYGYTPFFDHIMQL